MNKYLVGLLSLPVVVFSSTSFAIYKCTDAAGKATFSDIPCAENMATATVRGAAKLDSYEQQRAQNRLSREQQEARAVDYERAGKQGGIVTKSQALPKDYRDNKDDNPYSPYKPYKRAR